MKFPIAVMAFFVFTLGYSQEDSEPIKNTDRISKTIITKTIVETNDGKEVSVKREVLTAEEALALEEDGSTNQSVKRKPLAVTKSTSFVSNGEEYIIEPDAKGYKVTIVKNGSEKEYAMIRKLSRPNAYLIVTDEGNAFGYFDNEGDFIVESYDPDTDAIIVDTFAITEEDLN